MGQKFDARQSFYKLDCNACFMSHGIERTVYGRTVENLAFLLLSFVLFLCLPTFPFKCVSFSFKSILTVKHPFEFSGPYSEIRSAK